MESTSRKKPSPVWKILGAVLVAVFSWAGGFVLAVVMYAVAPPLRVDKMPDIPARNLVYAVTPPKPTSLPRQARDRLSKVLAGTPGVWRFTFPEVNAWLASRAGKPKPSEEPFQLVAQSPVCLRAKGRDALSWYGEAMLITPFGEFPLIIQAEGVFSRIATGVNFRPSVIKVNSLQVPALSSVQERLFAFIVDASTVTANKPESWAKITAITNDEAGVTISIP